jgi:S-(hydroxymethyl)glutathione dehydrogenase/alcohol dehydrogenase
MNNININAAILYELDKPLVVEKIISKKLLPGQVFVKIFYSGVCRSQLMEARGLRGNDPWLPHLLGHEASGEVLFIGDGVSKVKRGDKVIVGWIKGEGLDAQGAKYSNTKGDIINSGKVTTFSNYSVISENRLVKLDEEIPLDVAVLFGCALPTGAGIVFNELKPLENESIAVIGLGGIGLSALMALKEFNPKVLIAIDISDEKLKMAKEFGATHLINSKTQDVHLEINKIVPNGVDACVESGGQIETIELGISIIVKTGRLYFASHPEQGKFIKIDPFDLISGKKIFGSWGGGCKPDIDIPRLTNSYKRGKFPLNKLITKRYSLDQINEALSDLERGLVFRPLIEMTH